MAGMEMICLGSSSSGNCYLLNSDRETLVLECGIGIRHVKKALGWQLRRVVGCAVSHEHSDHAGHVCDFTECGIPVLAPEQAFSRMRRRTFCRTAEPHRGYAMGQFRIYTLPVSHDVPCLAFVISHPQMGRLLFVTDTMMVEHRVQGLSHIMIEANYADDILQHNMDEGIVPRSLRNRLMGSHMELGTTVDYLKGCDLATVNEITLLHLSGNNSWPERFQARVSAATGKPVYIARNGLKLNFSIEPY